MTTHYDNKTERWVAEEGFITVRGPSRDGVEQRLAELVARYKAISAERERQSNE